MKNLRKIFYLDKKTGTPENGDSCLRAQTVKRLEHDLGDKPTGSGACDDESQARPHITVVEHKAAQTSGTCAVKSRATDLGAARDDEVAVAGSPDTNEQLRAQT